MMITYKQWKKEAEIGLTENNNIANEIYLLKSTDLIRMEMGPFLSDMTLEIILEEGNMNLTIDMVDYEAEAPCMITILPNQIFRITKMSNPLRGSTIVMSRTFSDSLFNEYSSFNQLYKVIVESPVRRLVPEIKPAFDTYVALLEALIKSPMHIYKLEAAKHLTLSMFYGISHSLHDMKEAKPMNRKSVLFKQFEKELKQHYRKEREVAFYADRLCVTPKHLSAVVRAQTGKSALQCINEYVANECQAMLLSTSLTLQQISDKLNFPSQAVFSKFFKRLTGLSPRDYRKQGGV